MITEFLNAIQNMKTPKYFHQSQEEIKFYCIIKLATEISLFSLQISTNLMFCVDKIVYEHLAILSNLKSCQFARRIVRLFNLLYMFQHQYEDSQGYFP